MAFTLTREQTIFGNKKVVFINATLDSASGNVDTGLAIVDAFSFAAVSMATDGINVKKNLGSGATARNGILNVNSAASGDDICFVVYGR